MLTGNLASLISFFKRKKIMGHKSYINQKLKIIQEEKMLLLCVKKKKEGKTKYLILRTVNRH